MARKSIQDRIKLLKMRIKNAREELKLLHDLQQREIPKLPEGYIVAKIVDAWATQDSLEYELPDMNDDHFVVVPEKYGAEVYYVAKYYEKGVRDLREELPLLDTEFFLTEEGAILAFLSTGS